MPRSAPITRTRSNTRSFTGCLTCRKRKVKCDEAKPTCDKCRRVGVECAGYKLGLQWLQSGHLRDSIVHSGDVKLGSRHGDGRRRYILPAIAREAMTLQLSRPFDDDDSSLNKAIENLDQESPRLTAAGNRDATLSRGPFGVFRVEVIAADASAESPVLVEPVELEDANVSFDHGLLQDWCDGSDALSALNALPGESSSDWTAICWSQILSTTEPLDILNLNNGADYFASEENRTQESEIVPLTVAQYDLDQYPRDTSLNSPSANVLNIPSPTLSFSRSPSAPSPQLPPDAQYLLNHYVSQVTHAMSPMHISNSAPWTTIHLPCAMNALGELSAFGTTNYAKASLFYSLLAISAFHLDTVYNGPTRPDETVEHIRPNQSKTDWAKVAQKYRNVAVTALHKCLQSEEAAGASKAKYKEILMALLSMVTIGVISGSMQDTHSYLLESEKIIRTQNAKKPKKSKKTTVLHCIFSHIRIIDASTFVKPNPQSIYSSSTIRSPSSSPDSGHSASPLGSECDTLAISTVNLPDMLSTTGGSDSEATEDQEEAIYGIPSSLLSLISQTSILADEIDAFRLQNPRLAIPEDLAHRAGIIEKKICIWEREIKEHTLHGGREDILSISRSISCAMHYALLIYFFRRIRHTNPILLQSYVERVVEYLDAHEQAKARSGLDAGTIVWPSFIVACEAGSSELRRRTLECLGNAGKHGFRNHEPALQVVKEVWRRRDEGSADASWVDVLWEWGTHMVLT